MRQKKDDKLTEILKKIAPGTPIRDGLENILKARTGALLLFTDNEEYIKQIVYGGFFINEEYTSSKLYELAKMDGAIVISKDMKKILFANAELIPSCNISTLETGTRHRTAERTAKQTGERLHRCADSYGDRAQSFPVDQRLESEDRLQLCAGSHRGHAFRPASGCDRRGAGRLCRSACFSDWSVFSGIYVHSLSDRGCFRLFPQGENVRTQGARSRRDQSADPEPSAQLPLDLCPVRIALSAAAFDEDRSVCGTYSCRDHFDSRVRTCLRQSGR